MQTSHFESVRFHSSDISQVVFLYVLIVVDISIWYQYAGIWKIPVPNVELHRYCVPVLQHDWILGSGGTSNMQHNLEIQSTHLRTGTCDELCRGYLR